MYNKKSDGSVDALFEKCLSMRWLVIGEVSTFSTMLLHLLDGNLRRACRRHAYARRQDGSWRPFGGLNVVFCGDFWQLPPVRATSLFSNPFRHCIFSNALGFLVAVFVVATSFRFGKRSSISAAIVLVRLLAFFDSTFGYICQTLASTSSHVCLRVVT